MKTSEFIAKAIDEQNLLEITSVHGKIFLCPLFSNINYKWRIVYPELFEIIREVIRDSGIPSSNVILLFRLSDEEKNNFRLTLAEFLILYFQDQGD